MSVSAAAGTSVTVEQLRQYLRSPHTHRGRDAEVAERLGSITLSEHLTGRTLIGVCAERALGPETREQLSLLAAASILREAPKAEQPDLPTPNIVVQKQWIDAVVAFANGNLHHLPDFLATRVTESFDNARQAGKQKHGPPLIEMHPVGEFHREIAYRDGREVVDSGSQAAEGGANLATDVQSLSTWGEFGPVLTTVLGDAFAGDVRFSRWELRDGTTGGKPVAVLHYSVPRSGSHYLVDFCCYQTDEESAWLRFRDRPSYHGDIYFDPASEHIVRMTLETELGDAEPVSASGMAVDYGEVQIGGRSYICPVKSVAILVVRSSSKEAKAGAEAVTHLNETRFEDYRKFGSTTRILAPGEDLGAH